MKFTLKLDQKYPGYHCHYSGPKLATQYNPNLQFLDQRFPHILRIAKTAYLH
jgi:hypothetical protein